MDDVHQAVVGEQKEIILEMRLLLWRQDGLDETKHWLSSFLRNRELRPKYAKSD